MTDAPTRRPNVLFVITDQQRADHNGFMGNQVVQTPHLDALAARGMVFEQGWVANPVCMPNRSTIMTGRMPTAHGVIFNDRSLEWGANTWVRRFRAAGYRTGLIGKSHLQHGMSRNSVMAEPVGPVARDPWPAGWDSLEDYERYAEAPPEFPDDFYGFDTVELAIDHGAVVTGHHLYWALERGGSRAELEVPYSAEAPALKRSDRWWQVYQPPYAAELHSTSFVTRQTIEFIKDAAAQDSPWVAWASFPDPHHPMTPPGEWFDRHDPADMELPASINDPLEGAPEHVRRTQARPPTKQQNWVTPCGATDHDLVRECIAATYGMVEMIDDGVGQIMAAIDELDQTNDTIVVFTADHGDMMGEHGLMLKGFVHYRGTLQVPMVIADPTKAPGRTTALAGSIDLGPTLLDLAGLAGYVGIQGRSLAPVLDDPSVTVRDHILVEDDVSAALAAVRHLPKLRTLITATHKYTRTSHGEETLFDLVSDPDEMNDLSNGESSARAPMVEHLMDALIQADDQARGAPIEA